MQQGKYTIGDKEYIQRPLVLGQINQLIAVIKNIIIPNDFNVKALIGLLGSRLSSAMAIVLLESEAVDGKSKKEVSQYLRNRELPPIADEIEFSIDPETTVQVIEDFFDCNPIASLLERLSGMTGKISDKIKKEMEKTSSTSSASPSPEETSPKETVSSGVLLSESASHI